MKEITQLEELKEIELGIMKKLHSFCVSHDIKYVLGYGTLIGAMRHGGFIPWDDDIDIWMFRKDYDRLLAEFPAHEEEYGLRIVNHKTSTYFGRPMSKVIDSRTVLTEPEYLYDDPIGVFVDIWPLDYLPENEQEREKHTNQIRHYIRQLYGCITKDLNFNSLRAIKASIKAMLYRRFDPKKIVDKIDALSTKYKDSPSTYVCTPTFPKELFLREYFENSFLTKFEDTEFYAPSHYDEILTLHYGNWKQLPPKEQQVPHHVINVFWK